ncbi:Oxidoreductase sirO [Hyphodiscus hymeniophilus]|uniref:Oxidoreductase sirO n=1 Tax=Hyphodiscus hymeniophilus TaxID=353542 RepID=A0A9P6VS97_9HELO|nr:Oxidoreductase sirO [Hyphodiscus hymeniophilus]
MTPKSPLNLVLGAANVGDTTIDKIARFNTPDEVNSFLNTWYDRGYRDIDTARNYSPHARGSSEPRLGAVEAGKRFTIDTKVKSGQAGDHSKENIEKEIDVSLAALKVKKLDILYLHMPDRATAFEETVEAMDKGYREGKFKRFGLSNFTAAEVEQIVEISESKGFVKPSVYQGQFNPIVRGGEKELFPILRKHGIAFYAWSPAAAGFFNGNYKNIQPGGRFDQSHRLGGLYSSFYLKPGIEAATDQALSTASKYGINGHAAALRWTVYHSILSAEFGDSVIIGASSAAQLTSNIDYIEQGPLPEDVVTALEGLYKGIVADGEEIGYHF